MKGLDWPNERYVRSYTRDTPSWMVLRWEAQALYPQIRRKVDRAGVLDLGDEMKSEGLAAMLPKWPIEAIERGMENLLEKGWIEYNDALNWLLVPDFVESEEAAASNAQRSREHRSRRAAESRAQRNVAGGNETLQDATLVNGAQQAATGCNSVPSVPSVQEPEEEDCSNPQAGVEPPAVSYWWPCRKDTPRARAAERGGFEAPITELQVAEWQETYAGLDIEPQLRKCRQWSIDHPSRRKKDLAGHIGGWLGKAADRGEMTQIKKERRFPTEEEWRVKTGRPHWERPSSSFPDGCPPVREAVEKYEAQHGAGWRDPNWREDGARI